MLATQCWEEENILQPILTAKKAFGKTECPQKYTGALTIEFIRRSLAYYGVATSPRSVFIRGCSFEIDMIVPKDTAVPENGILYEAEEVLAAIEIKNHGVFGKGSSSCDKLRRCFQEI